MPSSAVGPALPNEAVIAMLLSLDGPFADEFGMLAAARGGEAVMPNMLVSVVPLAFGVVVPMTPAVVLPLMLTVLISALDPLADDVGLLIPPRRGDVTSLDVDISKDPPARLLKPLTTSVGKKARVVEPLGFSPELPAANKDEAFATVVLVEDRVPEDSTLEVGDLSSGTDETERPTDPDPTLETPETSAPGEIVRKEPLLPETMVVKLAVIPGTLLNAEGTVREPPLLPEIMAVKSAVVPPVPLNPGEAARAPPVISEPATSKVEGRPAVLLAAVVILPVLPVSKDPLFTSEPLSEDIEVDVEEDTAGRPLWPSLVKREGVLEGSILKDVTFTPFASLPPSSEAE